MDSEKDQSFLADVICLVLAYIKRISDLVELATLEAKLAVRTIILLAILVFVLGTVLTALWLSILSLVFIYLVSLHYSMVGAGAVIVVLNIIALSTILGVMYKIKNNLFFPKTCKQLNYNNTEGYDHARITTEN